MVFCLILSRCNRIVCPAEVNVCRSEIVEALVIAPMNVALNEGFDLGFEIAWQEVILQLDRFFRVWCQRSILHWVWGWHGAPRVCFMPRGGHYTRTMIRATIEWDFGETSRRV
jgi:hypothetical protein